MHLTVQQQRTARSLRTGTLFHSKAFMSDTLTATLPTREVTLAWSDALSLELDFMDDTHREFVDLLAATELADDDTLTERFAALIEHTEA